MGRYILFCFWVDSKGGWRPSFGGRIQRGQLPQFAIVAQAAMRPALCGSLGFHLPASATGGGRFRPFGRKNPKKPAVSWHTTLHEVRQRRTSESDCLQSPSEASERRSRLMAGIAKYSVLYLRPRLTGKRSVLLQERSFCTAGKRAGFCEWERAET